ncbi:hypothetical protein LJC10_01730 [Selenomonadales bacterium OttesenSCG-928-I06]|nr:hypothetical protein [Selenomonadales bacterium OttesenSCG-928-I06]
MQRYLTPIIAAIAIIAVLVTVSIKGPPQEEPLPAIADKSHLIFLFSKDYYNNLGYYRYYIAQEDVERIISNDNYAKTKEFELTVYIEPINKDGIKVLTDYVKEAKTKNPAEAKDGIIDETICMKEIDVSYLGKKKTLITKTERFFNKDSQLVFSQEIVDKREISLPGLSHLSENWDEICGLATLYITKEYNANKPEVEKITPEYLSFRSIYPNELQRTIYMFEDEDYRYHARELYLRGAIIGIGANRDLYPDKPPRNEEIFFISEPKTPKTQAQLENEVVELLNKKELVAIKEPTNRKIWAKGEFFEFNKSKDILIRRIIYYNKEGQIIYERPFIDTNKDKLWDLYVIHKYGRNKYYTKLTDKIEEYINEEYIKHKKHNKFFVD